MDSVTQAALGAAIGEAVIGKKTGYAGSIIGAVIATVPDLDVILLPFYSPLQRISIHRGYSHSILVTLILALLIAVLLKKMKWTRTETYGRLFLFSWLALFTHILLDAFTSYGTQLFLPFADTRISFDSITIVDPVYTLPLLIGLTLSLTIYRKLRLQRRVANTAGLVISTIYLLLTLTNKNSINSTFRDQLKANHISSEKLLTVPVSAANLHWYGVAKTNDSLYIGDYSQIKRKDIQFESFPVNDALLEDIDPKLTDRLIWFAKDYYTVAEMDGKIRFYNMQCDMQGIRSFGDYKAPTAWYYEITPEEDGGYQLKTGMHSAE